MNIPLSKIRRDGGTQPRTQINLFTVEDYAEEMRAGVRFPDVVLFFDGSDYWLADGFHRVLAAIKNALNDINADVRQGTVQDAQWYSYGANATHGLRRTNEDKRLATQGALSHPYASRYSDEQIALHVGVHRNTVLNYRNGHLAQNMQDRRIVNRNGTTYEMDTANIGTWRSGELPGWTDFEPERRIINDEAGPDYDSPEYQFGSDYTAAAIARRDGHYGVPLPNPEHYGLPADTQVSYSGSDEFEVKKPHVAHNSGNNEWYTPAEYIAAAREVMIAIDLDPASSFTANQVVKAASFHSIEDDGLAQEWYGRVWMNPPYAGELIGKFTSKLCAHFIAGDVSEAIVLVNNATETGWFQDMAAVASAICFPRGRVKFWHPEKEKESAPLQGQAVLYLGDKPKKFIAAFKDFGFVR